MSTGSKEPTATVFEPRDSFQYLTRHFDHIPHYLIRTSSPRSSGVTTNTRVASSAVEHKTSRVDIFSRDRQEAVRMLESHLLWKTRPTDNMVSWTSSFLFATQHAVRREQTDLPPSAPESIYVSIVDTRKLPRGSFFPAVALLEAYDIESEGKLKHDYYHGEYLSQGGMDVADDAIVSTTLEALIGHGLYELYPPFADEAKKHQLCRRVLELRQSFRRMREVPTSDEIRFAQAISVGCFPKIGIRPIVMMVLLSLKPRYRLDSTILEAFRENCLGMLVSDKGLENYESTSEYVPEHRQFAEMMYDVHAYSQRERQLKRAGLWDGKEQKTRLGVATVTDGQIKDEPDPSRDGNNLLTLLNRLSLNRNRLNEEQSISSISDASSTSKVLTVKNDNLFGSTNDISVRAASVNTMVEKVPLSSPKTRMIEMMEEEREEQQRALDQIDDHYEETRLCPECSGRISEVCFRRDHFGWCTVHERMTDENGNCPRSPPHGAPFEVMGCTKIRCDQSEQEAYWEGVGGNAILGGAGFREPGEPHFH